MSPIDNYSVTPYSASYSNIDFHKDIKASEKNDLMANKTKIYIDGVILSDHDNSSEVLNQLVNKGWLNSANSCGESEERVNLLNLISKFSMTRFMLKHHDNDNKYPFLEHDSQISMEFKYSSDSELEMRYSVNCGDGESDLFTLNCQIILGENFDLSGKGICVDFVFEKDCPDDLKKDLDCKALWQRIFDWLVNLFSQRSHTTNNTYKINNNIMINTHSCLSRTENVSPDYFDESADDNHSLAKNFERKKTEQKRDSLIPNMSLLVSESVKLNNSDLKFECERKNENLGHDISSVIKGITITVDLNGLIEDIDGELEWIEINKILKEIDEMFEKDDERDKKSIENINETHFAYLIKNFMEEEKIEFLVNADADEVCFAKFDEYIKRHSNMITNTNHESSTVHESSTDQEPEWDDFDLSPLSQQ